MPRGEEDIGRGQPDRRSYRGRESIPPEVFEPVRRQRGVDRGAEPKVSHRRGVSRV
jgi:hypothetical protein